MPKSQFLTGFAVALADVNRLHDQPTIVRNVMDGHGLTLDELRDAGVESYDLDEIAKCMVEG